MGNFKLDKEKIAWGTTAFLVIIACIAFYAIIQHFTGIREVLRSILKILSPFIWGAVIAYLLTPAVKFFQSKIFEPLGMRFFKGGKIKARKFGRGFAITFSLVVVLLIISGLFYFIIPQLYESIESIVTNISDSIEKLQDWADKWLDNYPLIDQNFSEILQDISGSITKWAKDTLLPQMQEIISTVSTGVISVFKTLANIIIAIAASVYIMYSREKFIAQTKKLMYAIFTTKFSKKLLTIFRFTDRAFMNFFSGKILDSAIVGVLCYIGCLIIGIKDPVLIAVIISITDIIPVFGPFIGTVPAALIVLMYSPIKCFIFIAFIIVLQQFDGNFLGPKILGGKTGMSGFWILFSITVSAALWGPIGMIIGFPLFVVLAAGVKTLVSDRLRKRKLPLATDTYDKLDYIDPVTNEPKIKVAVESQSVFHTKKKSVKVKTEKEGKNGEDK